MIHSQCDEMENVMTAQKPLELQQPASGRALPGCWKLVAGRAITLQPNEPGVVRIAHGQIWATFDGPHRGSFYNLGDHFLGAGEKLNVQAGQRLVIESWPGAGNDPAYFSWDPASAAQPQRVAQASRWHEQVARPFAELGVALAMAIGAFGRLVWGLAGYGEFLVAGRGRVMPMLESNQP
jgi:hypothetical protein